jgi:hypothetical protein
MLNEITDLLRGGADTFAAAEWVERDGAAIGHVAVAKRYAELITELYWKAKNLSAAIALGRLGIHYCLTHASPPPPAEASELRGIGKGMSFNIGSFAWPGWAEPGITISDADLAAGADAAKLNLRLAIELQRPPKAMSNAHWLMGAYAIVDRRTADAVDYFERAVALSEAAYDPAAAMMNRAYASLARLAAEPASVDREVEFTKAMKDLNAMQSDDAAFFVKQLITARQVFGSAR